MYILRSSFLALFIFVGIKNLCLQYNLATEKEFLVVDSKTTLHKVSDQKSIPFLPDQLPKAKSSNKFICSKLDSLREIIRKDSIPSELLFVNIDFSDKNAYGCLIRNKRFLTGISIEMTNGTENIFKIKKSAIQAISKKLFELFDAPNKFLDNLFFSSQNVLSHDNEMYFLLKVNGKIIIDKFFMRSAYLQSKNEQGKKLFLELGDLYSKH